MRVEPQGGLLLAMIDKVLEENLLHAVFTLQYLSSVLSL